MLSLHLRTHIDFKLVATDQQQYNEFILSLSNISHLVLFAVNPLPGTGVAEINLSLVLESLTFCLEVKEMWKRKCELLLK